MTRIIAVTTSLLITLSTALFGFVATHHPAYQTDNPFIYAAPALLVNGERIGTGHFSWRWPDGNGTSLHGTGPILFSNEFTVAPGSVFRLRNSPFWFGTREMNILLSEAEETPYGYAPGANALPVRLTPFGNLIAPDTPGQYIVGFEITFESYIPEVTGSGWAIYAFMFTVE